MSVNFVSKARITRCSTAKFSRFASTFSDGNAWLVRAGTVISPIAVAASQSARRRGLLGQICITRPLLLVPARQIHTVGMRCVIDVIWCRADGRILRIASVKPYRVTRVVIRAAFIIEAAAGSCVRWSLSTGDRIEIVND